MDNKKEIERNNLHSTIWKIAEELRGAIDGWDFKQYVLGILFYRYISENFTKYINDGERESGDPNFNFETLNDNVVNEENRTDLIKEKGFYIKPSFLFTSVVKNAENDENLNETLETIFKSIEESSIGYDSEKNLKGLFNDIDVNNNRLGSTTQERNKRLARILIRIKHKIFEFYFEKNC